MGRLTRDNAVAVTVSVSASVSVSVSLTHSSRGLTVLVRWQHVGLQGVDWPAEKPAREATVARNQDRHGERLRVRLHKRAPYLDHPSYDQNGALANTI